MPTPVAPPPMTTMSQGSGSSAGGRGGFAVLQPARASRRGFHAPSMAGIRALRIAATASPSSARAAAQLRTRGHRRARSAGRLRHWPASVVRRSSRSRPPGRRDTRRRARSSRSPSGRTTGTPRRSAWNCISRSLRAAPPSTRSSVEPRCPSPPASRRARRRPGRRCLRARRGRVCRRSCPRVMPDDRAARVRIPVRRAQAREGRHEVDAAAVRHASRRAPRRRRTLG